LYRLWEKDTGGGASSRDRGNGNDRWKLTTKQNERGGHRDDLVCGAQRSGDPCKNQKKEENRGLKKSVSAVSNKNNTKVGMGTPKKQSRHNWKAPQREEGREITPAKDPGCPSARLIKESGDFKAKHNAGSLCPKNHGKKING